MKKCPTCNHTFTSATVHGPIVWGKQQVSFDASNVITAVSPIISTTVMKQGKEFSRLERVMMTCPNPECNAMYPVDKFITVVSCPITGLTDCLVEYTIGKTTIKIHNTVPPEFVEDMDRWYHLLEVPMSNTMTENIKSGLYNAGYQGHMYR
jgi:hypothetical protein